MALTNEQYDSIMRDYEKKRRNAILDRDAKLTYINDNVDGYKELSDDISNLALERTKRAISGDKSALDDLKTMIDDLTKQKEMLLTAAGYPSDYLKPSFDCPDCQDTGYIDGQKCHCLKQKIISLLYEQSNISDMLQNVSIDKMSSDYYTGDALKNFLDSKEKAISFVEDFDTDYQNLLIYGTVGVGKSLLSSCIAKELLDSGHSVLYFSSSSLFDVMSKETFSYNSSKSGLENIYNCDLLIIDDLGTEMVNNFTVSSFFSLLNERALRKKSMVISTNLSLPNLRDMYTDRTFSRLAGSCKFCHMTGDDIRRVRKIK